MYISIDSILIFSYRWKGSALAFEFGFFGAFSGFALFRALNAQVRINIYIYIYVYTYIHIYIYIYTYVHTSNQAFLVIVSLLSNRLIV